MASALEELEYRMLREINEGVNLDEVNGWVGGMQQRRLSQRRGASISSDIGSFRELEEKLQLRDVWGTCTTPAMQTLECIHKVKQAIVEQDDEDGISTSLFACLVAVSLVLVVVVLLFCAAQRSAQ